MTGRAPSRSGRASRSDPVPLPRSAAQIVADLHALLRAAHVRGPYVLAGHSLGGLLSRLYAGTHPGQVVGFVSIDAAHEIFYEEFQARLRPEQYETPGLEIDIVATAAAMRRARVQRPLRPMPMVVLEHSRNRQRFPNPFSFPETYPIAAIERAFQASQDDLTQLVPGARHLIARRSAHYIQLDQPAVVKRAIRRVVKQLPAKRTHAARHVAQLRGSGRSNSSGSGGQVERAREAVEELAVPAKHLDHPGRDRAIRGELA